MTPRRLVFVTQLIDPSDPTLGFVVRLVEELSTRFERVSVVSNEVRAMPEHLPGNVDITSLGKERGLGRVSRLMRYESELWRLGRTLAPDALYAHMCPEYLWSAGPVAKIRGFKTVLWYAHPSVTPGLRLAMRLSDVVLTSLPGANPLPGEKVRAIGQATDTDRFPFFVRPFGGETIKLLALGRTSAYKGFEVLIRAVGLARTRGVDARLSIVGPAVNEHERRERVRLQGVVASLDLGDVVTLREGVPADQVPALLTEFDALVNATDDGNGDKTVFESMSTGMPAIVSNPAMRELLGGLPLDLLFRSRDPEDLALRLQEFSLSNDSTREYVGRALRERVVASHSLDHWSSEVLGTVEELSRGNRSGRRRRG